MIIAKQFFAEYFFSEYVHVRVLITYQGLLKIAILLKVIMINARAIFLQK